MSKLFQSSSRSLSNVNKCLSTSHMPHKPVSKGVRRFISVDFTQAEIHGANETHTFLAIYSDLLIRNGIYAIFVCSNICYPGKIIQFSLNDRLVAKRKHIQKFDVCEQSVVSSFCAPSTNDGGEFQNTSITNRTDCSSRSKTCYDIVCYARNSGEHRASGGPDGGGGDAEYLGKVCTSLGVGGWIRLSRQCLRNGW